MTDSLDSPLTFGSSLISDASNLTFIALVVLFFLTIIGYLIYSGLISGIEVKTSAPTVGPLVVAYKTAKGPYSGAGSIFTEAYSLLPQRKCMGVYYDDPENTAENDCRYAVGVILASGAEEPLPSELNLAVKQGFKIAHMPKPNFAVIAEFPFRTTLSIFIAIWRVYPKMKRYIVERGLCAYPAIELYESDHILFMFPLSRQEEFFVPEFSEEEVSLATTEASSCIRPASAISNPNDSLNATSADDRSVREQSRSVPRSQHGGASTTLDGTNLSTRLDEVSEADEENTDGESSVGSTHEEYGSVRRSKSNSPGKQPVVVQDEEEIFVKPRTPSMKREKVPKDVPTKEDENNPQTDDSSSLSSEFEVLEETN